MGPQSGNGTGSRTRAGAGALNLLAAPLNVRVLKALEPGSSALSDLRYATGSPPQSTMRLYMSSLSGIGAIERMSRREFPTSVDYAITDTGRDLLQVAEVLEAWLRQSPGRSLKLGSPEARNAIKPLVEGWSTNIVRALAGRSLSLTELDRLIPRVSYPSLERRLGAMRIVGLVEGHRVEGGSTPYTATDWLRRAVGPLVAATAWERKHLPETAPPIGRLDIEAAFLLAIPLMALPTSTTGKCRLTVEVQRGGSPVYAGVSVCIQEGKVTSCAPNLQGNAESWASGSPRAWLSRLDSGPTEALEVRGDATLAEAIVEALRSTLSKPR
ncbi:MAG TPA: winged helix-turn-helix transcriptional regulator [Solirubrobacterales bacterium]|nr:winged helix-turn-helix transcriptional regulator [Solirubrobacterales bacterium]